MTNEKFGQQVSTFILIFCAIGAVITIVFPFWIEKPGYGLQRDFGYGFFLSPPHVAGTFGELHLTIDVARAGLTLFAIAIIAGIAGVLRK